LNLATWETKRHLSRRVHILKAVAHPIRLCLVDALAAGPTHVTALADELEVPQAIVSQQLRILRIQGVVSVKRDKGLAVYRLEEKNLKSLLKCMDRCCSGKG
jgi:DNA-binding transcriptional ArsR family regulator